MRHYYSPLRYPGGKSKIYEYINQLILENGIIDTVYIEPFAGGAGAALELLFQEYVDEIIINDADKNIFSIWYSIINMTQEFIMKIRQTEISIEQWYVQRALLQSEESDNFTRGFAAFYLNRCNISGIINAGPIGGLEQNGKWKINARFNKEELIKRIERINFYADRISIFNKDWYDFINSLDVSKSDRYLIYFDPPYYEKGQDLYMDYFIHKDHSKLRDFLNITKHEQWLLTYDNNPNIAELYKDFNCDQFMLNYSVNNVREATELIIHSSSLRRPRKPKLKIAI